MQGHWPLVLFLWLLLHCPKKCSCPMALRLLYIIILSKNNTTDHVLKCKLYFDSRWHLSLQEKSQNLNMMRILKEPERHSILSPYSHVIYQEKGNYLYFKMVPNKVSSIQNEWTSDKYYVPKTELRVADALWLPSPCMSRDIPVVRRMRTTFWLLINYCVISSYAKFRGNRICHYGVICIRVVPPQL